MEDTAELKEELKQLEDSQWVTIGVRYRKNDPLYQDILKLVDKYAGKNSKYGAASVLKSFAKVWIKRLRERGEL